jgi:hypothetical protein
MGYPYERVCPIIPLKRCFELDARRSYRTGQ